MMNLLVPIVVVIIAIVAGISWSLALLLLRSWMDYPWMITFGVHECNPRMKYLLDGG